MLENKKSKQDAAWTIWRVWRWPLHGQIGLGLIVGSLVGWMLGLWAVKTTQGVVDPSWAAGQKVTSHGLYLVLDLWGDLFLNGLKLIIVPLVVSSVMLALININRSAVNESDEPEDAVGCSGGGNGSGGSGGSGGGGGVGRLGFKTLGYYMATSFCAIMVGLFLVNIFAPGVREGVGILAGQDLSAFAESQAQVEAKTEGKSASDFLGVFRSMVPANLLGAATNNGQLLGLIVVALVCGYFLSQMKSDEAKTLIRLVQAIYDLSMKVTDLVLRFAPIGVMGLLGATISQQYAKLVPNEGFQAFLAGILIFAAVALSALLIHMLVTMSLVLSLVAKVNPIKHIKAMAPALMTAFSTASSSSTLPVTLECVEERAGVSKKTASFVLPLGATVNMDGTALYECVAAMFICQAFGVDLTLGQQFLVVMTALLTSIGVAGVPSASLVAIVIILQAVQTNLPEGSLAEGVLLTSGLGLLMFFDRPLDMCRTAVNVFSDSVGAVVIAKTEGEQPVSD